ncbi:MAG: multidrug effflux MFS transporter [Gammaproteobacteria bacterium]|nr:multidrug effflux MFS transporter [Gammaproteobacteria bacterium]
MSTKPPGMSRILVLLGAISLLAPFSIDLYLPALPAIALDLHASAAAVQLTLPAFFVGLAISQLLFGSLADRFGRRPPLLAGLALVVLTSIGCALAPNAAALTVWRVFQAIGVGSATVIPRAVVRDRFEVGHVARAMSLLGIISGLGPILAPQFGGLLLSLGSWRLLFVLLSVMAIGSLAAATAMLEESRPAGRGPAIGPRLWMSVLTDRRFLRFALPATLISASVFAYLAGAPFVFIDQLHLTPQHFAWLFGINALGLMSGGRINAHIVVRVAPETIFRRAMLATASINAVLLLVVLSGRGGFWGLALPLFCFVTMLGFNFANGFALALAPFGAAAGTASAMYGTLQFTLAGVAGAAVSTFYDGSPRSMAAVMFALSAAAVLLYRAMRLPEGFDARPLAR